MSYINLINELLDPKRVSSNPEVLRAPNSLELRAARAIYSLLVKLENVQRANDNPDNSITTQEGQSEPIGRQD